MKKYYKISEELLVELMKDSLILAALEGGGVDNWEWYSESCNDFLNEYFNGIEDFEELAKQQLKESDLEIIKEEENNV